MADVIAEQAQGAATVSFYGVPYPAGDASWKTVLSTSYFRSKENGSLLLHNYLQEVIAACPSSKLVVMGYSQGAHAAGDQLAVEPKSVTDHVAALVMFGDPRFNPNTTYTWGTYDARDHGINGARSGNDFSTWSSRVYSFCSQGDLVCQGIGIGHGTDTHGQQAYLNNYKDLVAGLIRRRLGFPKPATSLTPLDLAFVIDSTGSMGSSIAGVSAAAARMALTVKNRGVDVHIGLVDYKDTNQGDPYAARVALPMTSDAGAFGTAVSGLVASGGGDTPEAVFSGLMTAINQLSWRSVPRKAIIVMGDAAAKDPEPITGYTRAGVLAAARALDPAVIYPVAVSSSPLADFQGLADGSGGQLFEAFGGSTDVSDQIVAAVDKASVPLFTSLTVSSPARPGTDVLFSAAGSYYDDGDISDYEWDFDGDGTTDATTPGNQTSHMYASGFTGIAKVTVVTADGNRGTATSPVEIRPDAPQAPGVPQHLVVSAGADHASLDMRWDPPADLGGGTLAGYVIEVDDAGTGAPVTQQIIESGTEASAPGLAAGAYRVRVWAANEAGIGDSAEANAELVTIPDEPPLTFSGFLWPVLNPPRINHALAGSTVPLRFGLGGDHGLDVFASGYPRSQRIDCKSLAPQGAATPATSPPSRLIYHPLRDRYTYLWPTAKTWRRTCRQVVLRLTDGSEHRVNFNFDRPENHHHHWRHEGRHSHRRVRAE